jgi:hypothetical protein
MNDQVNFLSHKRVFALLRECSDAPKLMKRRPSISIANRTCENNPYLSGRLDAANKIGDVTGLPAGQVTSPGAEANLHDQTSYLLGSSSQDADRWSLDDMAMIFQLSFVDIPKRLLRLSRNSCYK